MAYNNEEALEIRRIAGQLWALFCEVKLRDTDELKAKIQELNRVVGNG
jgi:hypothetical protein